MEQLLLLLLGREGGVVGHPEEREGEEACQSGRAGVRDRFVLNVLSMTLAALLKMHSCVSTDVVCLVAGHLADVLSSRHDLAVEQVSPWSAGSGVEVEVWRGFPLLGSGSREASWDVLARNAGRRERFEDRGQARQHRASVQ